MGAINLTLIENINSTVDGVRWINQATGISFLGLGSVMLFFIVFLPMIFRNHDFIESLASSSFICLMYSVIFGTLGLVSFTYMMLYTFMLIIFGSMLYIRKNSS